MWDRHWVLDPSFNPEDPDLILFTHAPYANDTRQVCILRLSTGERTVAYEGSVMLRCQWLDGNRIVVNTDQGVCLVDRSGTAPVCLTGPGYFAYVVDRQNLRIAINRSTGGLLIDTHGAVTDTLAEYCGFQVVSIWLPTGNVVELHCNGLRMVNPWNCTREVVAPLAQGARGCGTGLTGMPGNSVVWSQTTGLYRTNLSSKETVLLRNACDRTFLAGLSYDPVGDRILSSMQHFEPDGTTLLRISSKLVLLDGEGATIQEISLQW